MKKYLIGMVLAVALFAMAGCGGGDDHVDLFETVISSDIAVDGDIVEDTTGARAVTRADTVPGIFAGVDPVNEFIYRAFLHFPLDSVPLNAAISSATLSIVIRSVDLVALNATIPIRIELVSFVPPLIISDFDLLPALASTDIFPAISAADVNREVKVNVTGLMREAQRLGLDDFQIRIRQVDDFTTAFPGRIEIDEELAANEPLLTVVYF